MNVRAPLVALALLLTFAPALSQANPPIDIQLWCNGAVAGSIGTMEGSYIASQCWAHIGLHHYFVGKDKVYSLVGGSGNVFSVEQQNSPPTEYGNATTSPAQVYSAIPVEVSLDGVTWTQVAEIEYKFAGLAPGGNSGRQSINYAYTAHDEEFRFLRIRQPTSAAQGLSGYLDSSTMLIQVNEVGPAPVPTLTAQTGVTKTCVADLVENVFATHPCTHGEVNRWDAPSFFHSYFLGNASLDRIQGKHTLLDFRNEDSIADTTAPVLVQTSVDGVSWTTHGTITTTYGVEKTWDIPNLGGEEAKFVRLVSGKHPSYNNGGALKHAEGYFVSSQITLDGLLPS